MELNERADIDPGSIQDVRGSGGGGGIGGLPIGGGGLAGIVVTLVIALVGGYFGINTLGGEDSAPTGNSTAQCSNEQERTKLLECRNGLYVTSIQRYWQKALPESFGEQYKAAPTFIFSNRVTTGCGAADSGVGPFYCPADDRVYIDLTFYQVLSKELGAPGAPATVAADGDGPAQRGGGSAVGSFPAAGPGH
ncbi:neutral zinc metallopeptidase, partial [Actinoplanes philippinensis]|uniref:neutral zinc metallopeptidase n=1 Tax=Actinoplanes philippinensis TaxID=35752 RepID=UPI0033EC69B3